MASRMEQDNSIVLAAGGKEVRNAAVGGYAAQSKSPLGASLGLLLATLLSPNLLFNSGIANFCCHEHVLQETSRTCLDCIPS